VNGFKAYRYYIAIKLHFTKDAFNVFENRGNVKGSYETFKARNDSYLFEKMGKKHPNDAEIIQFFVANMIMGDSSTIYNDAVAEENFKQWLSWKESITYNFKEDLHKLELEVEKNGYTSDELFNCTLNDFPIIIKLYLGKQINPITMAMITDIYEPASEWLNNSTLSLVLEQEIRTLYKMNGFFKYDKEKIEKLFYDFLSNFDVGSYK
jgi:hypothetical protein